MIDCQREKNDHFRCQGSRNSPAQAYHHNVQGEAPNRYLFGDVLFFSSREYDGHKEDNRRNKYEIVDPGCHIAHDTHKVGEHLNQVDGVSELVIGPLYRGE